MMLNRKAHRVRVIVGAGTLLLGLAACKPEIAAPSDVLPIPDLSGKWAYSATEIRATGVQGDGDCTIDQVTITLAPWRFNGFFGRSDGGRLQCSGDLAALSSPLPPYSIRRGGMLLVSDFVLFWLGNHEWQHEGYLAGDSIAGTFFLRTGGADLVGNFKAKRQR
jgi:hypothetical protein